MADYCTACSIGQIALVKDDSRFSASEHSVFSLRPPELNEKAAGHTALFAIGIAAFVREACGIFAVSILTLLFLQKI